MSKKMGRPSDLNDKIKEIASNLAKDGLTIKQIASKLGVGERTLYTWLGNDKDFRQSLKEATALADDLVEASLYRRANGYTHAEEKIHFTPTGKVIRAKTLKHYPPSETAMIFWLKNRQPDKWREKHDSQPVTDIPIVIAKDEQDL